MQKFLTPAEAVRNLNNYQTIKSEILDGYLLIKRKTNTNFLYEVKVFANGIEDPIIRNNSNIVYVLKILNNPKIKAWAIGKNERK